MQTLKLSLLAGAAMTLAACSSHPTGSTAMVTTEQLQGSVWQVNTLNGSDVGDALVTLNFHEPGRLAGKAACNNYMASYTLEDDNFTVKTGGVTMMACPQPLMKLEQQFLDALDAVNQADLSEDGQLILSGADDVRIQASRQK